MRYDNGFAAAQRAYDAMEPPDDPWELAWEFAAEATLLELREQRYIAARNNDPAGRSFWAARCSERPRPEDLDLCVFPDEENTVVLYNFSEDRNWATWPLWLESVCPGYTKAVALAIAQRTYWDTHRFLLEEYIP